MKIYDISMTVTSDMPVYKGRKHKKPLFATDSDFKTGTAYETRLTMNLHTGTHLDAPLHFIEGGGTIEKIPLERFITRARVVDVTHVENGISAQDLDGKGIKAGDFVLLKTRNSFEDLLEGDFVYLDGTGARYLTDLGVAGVGTDALGVARAQPEHETHKTLLSAGVIILEGLRLADVPEGEYLLIAAPVKIAAEAAPARAMLIEGLSL
ncbi:MAG: cyclase family protein [Christensenellaceae bacterium]|nr:cyclase family protein [Christensenellaceae bacterium]